MTKLFPQAVGKVSMLPEADQHAIARLVLDEVESDRRWDRLVADSPRQLADLADNDWAENERGESKPLNPENL